MSDLNPPLFKALGHPYGRPITETSIKKKLYNGVKKYPTYLSRIFYLYICKLAWLKNKKI